jgi:hypothetical protein
MCLHAHTDKQTHTQKDTDRLTEGNNPSKKGNPFIWISLENIMLCGTCQAQKDEPYVSSPVCGSKQGYGLEVLLNSKTFPSTAKMNE